MERVSDILDGHLTGESELTDGQYHHCKDAMDEHAKQMSISFAEWISSEGWEQYDGKGSYIQPSTRYVKTTEQLYTKYFETL